MGSIISVDASISIQGREAGPDQHRQYCSVQILLQLSSHVGVVGSPKDSQW